MAEQHPKEIERLFRDVLFAEYENVSELQDHMESFLTAIETIRQELFPSFYRYKQDRHAASCYLSFFAPETHFIYRYSEAEEFAKYIEFGKDLGAGAEFKLENYYEMAEIIVEAMKEHTSLLDKYETLIYGDERYYYDRSLHLMAFDLMYCCRWHNFYNGLSHAQKKDRLKAYTVKQLREKEEADRRKIITKLEDEIHSLDLQMELLGEIPLLGVEVTQKTYGTGTIIEQEGSKITVRFPEEVKTYIINKRYPIRPRFENDDAVVEAFTQFDALKDKKKELQKKLERL